MRTKPEVHSQTRTGNHRGLVVSVSWGVPLCSVGVLAVSGRCWACLDSITHSASSHFPALSLQSFSSQSLSPLRNNNRIGEKEGGRYSPRGEGGGWEEEPEREEGRFREEVKDEGRE